MEKRKILKYLFSSILIVLTAHALTIHTMAGELSPLEIIAIEVTWIPILVLTNENCRRALWVLFAAFSGYFLPRLLELLPWSILHILFVPDILFNNFFFNLLGLNAKMVTWRGGVGIVMKGVGAVGYLVGCSSLREIPMLVAMALAVPTEWRKRVLASLIASVLVFPTNALRIAVILWAAKAFKWDLLTSHILLSPILTLVLVTALMTLQDVILDKKLFIYLEKGMRCLF
ncbi:hypothetical protein IPA_00065 [Ignicoccus pacificus DSM 13166]|uniref:Exosortase/archaeosortase family protein n=1 Tax=Ignicoccus pacificus DSM 13166 TaxID=940294 RepID=A0A977PKE9_9CREN|nr:hypothetical protein IPA_00065 [Ignicoccus pacificus DSM 13166]